MTRRPGTLCAVALAAAVLSVAGRARACGVSATGVASCSLAEHDEAVRPKFAFGVGGLATRTVLRFDGSLRAEQSRYAVLAEFAYFPSRSVALDLGAGVAFGGSLDVPDGKYAFSPGPAAALGAAWRVLDQPGYFGLFTAQLSWVASRTQRDTESSVPYQAFDLRLGGALGLNVARVFHPYVLARVFGGPVFWRYQGESVSGTDIHHYQVGLGASLGLGSRLTLVAEVIPLGEQAVSAGASLSF